LASDSERRFVLIGFSHLLLANHFSRAIVGTECFHSVAIANAFHTPAAARRKLTFALDLESRELALLGLFQLLIVLCCVGMGQIGLIGFLRLAL
jgi:hypothetical protein